MATARGIILQPLIPPTEYTKNIIVRNTVKIWIQCKQNFNWTSFSLRAPIHSNHLFKPSLLDKTFQDWDDLGIKTFADLFVNGIFISFTALRDKFNVPKRDFFRYLQIRDFTSK